MPATSDWPPPEIIASGVVTPQKPSTVSKDLGDSTWQPPEVAASSAPTPKKAAPPVSAPQQGFWANFSQGAKEKVKDYGRGIEAALQLQGQLADTGVPGMSPQEQSDLIKQRQANVAQVAAQQAQANQQNAGLKKTWGGMLGGVAPTLAGTAMFPGSMAGQAAAGAVAGSLDPDSSPGSGAAFGAIGSGIAKGIGQLIPTKMIGDRMQVLVDYLKSKGITPDLAQQLGSKWAQTLKNFASDSPITGKGMTQENLNKFTQTVVQDRVGEVGAQDASPEVLGSASRRIGAQFDTVASNTNPLLQPEHLQALAGIMKDAENNVADPNAVAAIRKRIVSILNVARRQSVDIGERAPGEPVVPTPDIVVGGPPAVQGTSVGQPAPGALGPVSTSGPGSSQVPPSAGSTPYMTGRQWSNIKQWMDKWVMGKDPNLSEFGGQIQDVLNQALRDSADPKYVALLDKSNQQYRNLLFAAKAANSEGQIPPASFWNAVNQKNNWRQAKTDVAGDQETAELARAGSAVLKDRTPNSGTPARILPYLLTSGAGAYGGYEAGGWKGGAEGAGLGLAGARWAGPLLANQLVNNPRIANLLASVAVRPETKTLILKALARAGGGFGQGLGSAPTSLNDPEAEDLASGK